MYCQDINMKYTLVDDSWIQHRCYAFTWNGHISGVSAPIQLQLPVNVQPWRWKLMVAGTTWETQMRFWFMVLTWHSPSACRYVWTEWAGQESLFLSLSILLFQMSKNQSIKTFWSNKIFYGKYLKKKSVQAHIWYHTSSYQNWWLIIFLWIKKAISKYKC